MSSDHGRPGGGVEWLGDGDENGNEDVTSGGLEPRRWPRWAPFVVVLALAGLIAGLLITQHGSHRPVAAPTSAVATSTGLPPGPVIPAFSDLPSTAPYSPIPLDTPSPRLTARTTVALGRSDLGITDGYELFARGPGVVERIQFAAGLLTATPVPPVTSTGPVNFAVGPHAALVHPQDRVPGYSVPDGGAAIRLAGALGHGGPIFPGPDPAHVWVEPERSRNTLVLADFHGHATHTTLTLPAGARPIGPDGSGYVLVDTADGMYDVRPATRTRVTTGSVLAVGPTGWLVRECDRRAHCSTVYVDRKSAQRRTIHVAVNPSGVPGVIAPDGTVAALPEAEGGSATLHLINLITGHDTALQVSVRPGYGTSPLAWSPDGHWLFVAGDRLRAVDATTGHLYEIGAGPRNVTFRQVVVRPAPRRN